MKSLRALLAGLCLAALAQAQPVDAGLLAALRWRNIGPFRGGRVSAVAGGPGNPAVFYIGLPQGGVWKTTSAGQTWFPTFDAIEEVSSIGSVGVAPSDAAVVYAGTGEISGGNEGLGIYRSADTGKTWKHIGLEETGQINAILIDPKDSDKVVVAALGRGNARSEHRGVYRTEDGGRTWIKVLSIDAEIGVQHLAWAPDDPTVVYAATMRSFFAPGSPGRQPGSQRPPSGTMIYRSEDEGRTWKKLEGTGLPRIDGRVCMAVANRTEGRRAYLIGTFGLYRTDDGGRTWKQMASDDDRIANGQGNYTSGVYIDPKNTDVVYTLATCVYRSLDGGKTFQPFKGAPGGDDPQQMWIDPMDGDHLLLAGDQGAVVTLDAGRTWGNWYNQPTGQIYHVSVDNQFPYWVYGSQQDSGCIGTSSRGNLGQITPLDWAPHPGFEVGWILPDPLDPRITYSPGGALNLVRVTNPSGQVTEIDPALNPADGLRGALGPIQFARANPHELLAGYQCLMSTTDRGAHWTHLSPDLSLAKGAKPPPPNQGRFSGPGISAIGTTGASSRVIWVGTATGLVQVTRDHGLSWTDVSPPKSAGVDKAAVIDMDVSQRDPATAYIAFATFAGNDRGPYYLRTYDFGKTWVKIVHGLPTDGPGGARSSVIRADPKRTGLLFAATGQGIFVSFDDGDDWQSLRLNLPRTPVTDMVVHGDDLVISTFGRGFWILDNFTPLRELAVVAKTGGGHLFAPGDAVRVRRNVNGDTPYPPEVPHADNPPPGAVIYYSLPAKSNGEIHLEILDRSGNVVRRVTGAPVDQPQSHSPLVPDFWIEKLQPLPAEAGLNRVIWNMRYDTPPAFMHYVSDVMGANVGQTPTSIEGPLALPGDYTVRLTVDGQTYTRPLKVVNDPRSTASSADLRRLHELEMDLYTGTVESWAGYQRVAAIRAQIAKVLEGKPGPDVEKAAKDFDAKLAAVGGKVTHPQRYFFPPSGAADFEAFNEYLLARMDALGASDLAPSEPEMYAYGADWSKLDALATKWRSLCGKDLAYFNGLLAKHGIAPLTAPDPSLPSMRRPPERYLPMPAQEAPKK